MSQQAQNDYYGGSREQAAMDYAAAVNEEIRDLFAAGADIVQIDEPYMQARPEKARAVRPEGAEPRARRRHRHDGGAHLLRLRGDHPRSGPSGYSFLPELAGCRCQQVSIETAQSKLDCRVLAQLPGKQIMVGVHRPVRPRRSRRRSVVAARIRRALPYVAPENVILAPDCGMKYLPRDVGRSASCARWSRARAIVRGNTTSKA